jgi:hypothetical protein
VFNWLKTSATEIQDEVENPFVEESFDDFTWQRILTRVDDMDWNSEPSLNFFKLLFLCWI